MEDKELLNGIIEGKKEASYAMVHQYSGMVFRLAMSFVNNREDAEDISQEVFMDAFANISRFRHTSSLSTWLYRISINKSINFNKKKKQYAFLQPFVNSSHEKNIDIITEKNNFEISPEDILVLAEKNKILYSRINKLPKNQKIAFTLNKIDGMSYKEISEIMSVSVASVESLIHRAKMELQSSLLKLFR